MESPYHTVYKRNPEADEGKITLSATGDISNWCYLQVIAQIQQDTILEYVAYKGVKNIRPPPKNSDSLGGVNTTVFVVVAIILLALIAGLVVLVFIFQQRNKSLLNQVKHVSFQQNSGTAINTSSSDPDLLLQKNQQ